MQSWTRNLQFVFLSLLIVSHLEPSPINNAYHPPPRVRILHGDALARIGIASPVYDWQQLRRWGISESQSSAGNSIQFYVLGAVQVANHHRLDLMSPGSRAH